jgi:multidrug efflux pump subunit AcrA (membrane-fusion protein)
VKRASKAVIVIAAAVVVAGVGLFLFRGKIFPAADPASSKDPVSVNVVKVTRGDLHASVAASGQFQPNTIVTIRPDSNMPTRKIVKIDVVEGQRVKVGQPLAEIEATGLDLTLKSDVANLQSARVKLDNLKAKPADMDLAAAQAALTQAEAALATQKENYDSVMALADKGLASRNQLSDAERQLASAQASYDASRLSYQNTKAQSQEDVISAQEAVVAQADYAMQMAKLILDSTVIRSPMTGMVAEVLVNVGDLVSPSTAIATVVDPDPMWLQAQVNENDMAQVKVGQKASVTVSSYPDLQFTGTVTQIDPHAQVVNNVSVFSATIEVPNRGGRILWGMNADAEISVLSLKNVLTLPSSAIKSNNGSPQVTIIDGGRLVAWDVQSGATDGTRTQIVAGLDEGQEVVVQRRTSTSGTRQGGPGGPGSMGQVFRVLR